MTESPTGQTGAMVAKSVTNDTMTRKTTMSEENDENIVLDWELEDETLKENDCND